MKSKITQDKTIIKAGTTTAGATNPQVSPVGETFGNDERKTQLKQCEDIIAQNENGPFITGRNLAIINSQFLYKLDGFSSFEVYCRDRWGMSDKHAYRLINAAKCYDMLAEHKKEKGWVMPRHEAQIRPLAALPDTDWVATWKKFLKKISGAAYTADNVEEFINGGEKKTKASDKNNAANADTSTEQDQEAEEIPAKALQEKLEKIDELVSKALEKVTDDGAIPVMKFRKLLEQIKELIETTK